MRIGLVLGVLMLSACVLGGAKGGKDVPPPANPITANPITGAEISTTSLDAPDGAASPAGAVKPQPDEATEASDEATEEAAKADTPAETPSAPQTPEEAKCLKSGDVWAAAGKSGARACVRRTKDAGKSCTKQTQCEGFCLSRSMTCAPVTPMFGCNDILQADGRPVTLCID